MGGMRRTHLQQLEAEAIHVMREVVAQFERPVMLYSIGKDSSVLLHLARKAFHPGGIPFPAGSEELARQCALPAYSGALVCSDEALAHVLRQIGFSGIGAAEARSRADDVSLTQNGLWLNWARFGDRSALERGLRRCEDIALGRS